MHERVPAFTKLWFSDHVAAGSSFRPQPVLFLGTFRSNCEKPLPASSCLYVRVYLNKNRADFKGIFAFRTLTKILNTPILVKTGEQTMYISPLLDIVNASVLCEVRAEAEETDEH